MNTTYTNTIRARLAPHFGGDDSLTNLECCVNHNVYVDTNLGLKLNITESAYVNHPKKKI